MFAKKAETTDQVESGAQASAPADPETPTDAPAPEAPADRFEEYDAVKPDGEVVHIRRNIETGDTEIVK